MPRPNGSFMCMDSAAKIPTSRRRAGHFPYPPVSHEPRIQALSDSLARDGLHPFHLPLGILLDEKDGKPTPTSICIRCDAFDGFPCLLNGKADAQVVCVDPALKAYPNVTLMTGAYVSRLETDASWSTVTGIYVTRDGREERIRPISSWSPAAPCRQRCCCCDLPTTAIQRSGQWLRPGRTQLHAP